MTAGGTSTLIRGARVFDGERLTQASNVLLADGSITGIGDGLGASPGAEVMEGRGRTLLPGLIDSHVHAGDVRALGQALTFGVTTELDMFSDPDLAARRRSLAARRDDVADIRTAVQGATAPGGPWRGSRRTCPPWPARRTRRQSSQLRWPRARTTSGLPGRPRLVPQPGPVRRYHPRAGGSRA